jgi:alpha-glucosidase
MWTDIGTIEITFFSLSIMLTVPDYMDRRRIFTVDPDYFPLNRMREIISYLHSHGQKYGMTRYCPSIESPVMSVIVLMTDPAVAFVTNGRIWCL